MRRKKAFEVQAAEHKDIDSTIMEQETYDILVKAGYYRACIKGLSAFDKVVGGMTWCIECSNYDVDIDLLFHENLTLGQKIGLVEKIVVILPQMKCPHLIEPHQIQALEFLSIYKIIQWLVKTSVENTMERNLYLRKIAVGQFYNNYQYKSDEENAEKLLGASNLVKKIQIEYIPKEDGDESISSASIILLEHNYPNSITNNSKIVSSSPIAPNQEIYDRAIYQTQEVFSKSHQKLNCIQMHVLKSHYQGVKDEMDTGVKHLREKNKVKSLEIAKFTIIKKINTYETDIQDTIKKILQQRDEVEVILRENKELKDCLAHYKIMEDQIEHELLHNVQTLLNYHDDLKKQEADFKEQSRIALDNLQQKIVESEAFFMQKPQELEAHVATQKERIRIMKLQLAKRNRSVVAIERQLDNTPDRTELSLYQRRFHELHIEISAKHLETKQNYTFYNTLSDKKRFMQKELILLNSICEAYNQSMMTLPDCEEFIQQFESIVNWVKEMEAKVRVKYNEEKRNIQTLNDELHGISELQRQLLHNVQTLLNYHDDLKKQEADFKEQSRIALDNLQQKIVESEAFFMQKPQELEAHVATQKERIRIMKLQLAKRNRSVVAIERQLDNTPDRTELSLYQRRFHELHIEISAKHLETKQNYTFYNTLSDKKRFMQKELILLNSICEAYNQSMMTLPDCEEFIQQFESIVNWVKEMEAKVRVKYNEEKRNIQTLNDELHGISELQRQYVSAVKQLTTEFRRCELLQQNFRK